MNVEYYPPSKVLLDVLPLPSSARGFNRCRSFSANEIAIAVSFSRDYVEAYST